MKKMIFTDGRRFVLKKKDLSGGWTTIRQISEKTCHNMAIGMALPVVRK